MSKPCVGISTNVTRHPVWGDAQLLYSSYVTLVARHGGLPLLLPLVASLSEAEEVAARLDGMVLTGGRDIDPGYYGQTARRPEQISPRARSESDLAYARAARERGIPLLGICLGAQTINVAFGGTLLQHLPEDVPGSHPHEDEPEGTSHDHPIRLEPGSLLARIAGADEVTVNSYHHQGFDRPAPGFQVAARAPDGVIEAIECADHPFLIGVSWHPERMLDAPITTRIVRAFVDAARGAPARAGR